MKTIEEKSVIGKFAYIRRQRMICRKRDGRKNIYGETTRVRVKGGSIETLIYNNSTTSTGPILFDIHGGGFMFNSNRDDDDLCQYLHERIGIKVVGCNYRRTPKYPFPIGLEDIYETIKYISSCPEHQVDKNKIIILGHSAGGNLAAAVTLLANVRKEFLPCLQILDYPYLNLSLDGRKRPRIRKSLPSKLMKTFSDYYVREEEDKRNPFVSPVFAAGNMIKGLPPTYILTCGRDNLNIDGEEYAKKLRDNGVSVTEQVYDRAVHGFVENAFNYPYIPWRVKTGITEEQKRMAYDAVNKWCACIKENILV